MLPTQKKTILKTYTGRHAMHKYWSKKPAEMVAMYIERHSRPHDVIIDPFCGSGISISETVRLDRRAIGIDINPIAIRQTLAGIEHIDMPGLLAAFNAIKTSVEPLIRAFYQVTCPHCHQQHALTTHMIWHHDKPIESRIYCAHCHTKSTTNNPDYPDFDQRLLNNIDIHHSIKANSKLNVLEDKNIIDFFTPRNAYSLHCLLTAIDAIDDDLIRQTLQLCFTGAVSQASKLVFVIRNRYGKKHRAQVGSWTSGFWLPDEYFEIYPWQCFENRFNRIVSGKKEVDAHLPDVARHHGIDALLSDSRGYLVDCRSATDLSMIPSESVDYVITDPPHGNRIPYLELSQLWNGWLNLIPDWEQEIVVSNAKSRGKNLTVYEENLVSAFCEIGRVLKAGKYLSIMFNARDFQTWAILLTALGKASLYLTTAEKMPYSSGSLAQDTRKNALAYDLIITCQKQVNTPENRVSEQQLTIWIRNILSGKTRTTHELLRLCVSQASESRQVICPLHYIETLQKTASYKKQTWQLP